MQPESWSDLDARHIWHPYTQMATAPAPIPVERAEGSYLYTPDGRAILDAISSWWVNLHGHGHPRIVAAIREQAARLDHVIFAGFAHEPAARLAARLAAIAPPGLGRVFYSDDGSTAVEVALKMAFQFHWNRGERRDLIVGLDGGYHGDTFGAMAAGGVPEYHEAFRPLLFRVLRAPAPTCRRCPEGKERTTCGIECARALDGLLSANPGRVAAVILEPMLLGAGGMIVCPREFLVEVHAACKRRGVLLIADEVLTGFGRTGEMFACGHGPVRPDILCLSKALTGGVLPLAATLATEEVYEAFLSPDRSRALLHGHSYTANPIACAAALASLDVLEEGRGVERAREIEAIHRERLARLRRRPRVVDTRSIGLVAAAELAPSAGAGGYFDDVGPRLAREFLARGVLLRPLGNVVYALPPLSVTDAEVHRIHDAIEEVLGKVLE
jgi:adenosylmethionine-8-amino-7-oxononanoate aminotransferase